MRNGCTVFVLVSNAVKQRQRLTVVSFHVKNVTLILINFVFNKIRVKIVTMLVLITDCNILVNSWVGCLL